MECERRSIAAYQAKKDCPHHIFKMKRITAEYKDELRALCRDADLDCDTAYKVLKWFDFDYFMMEHPDYDEEEPYWFQEW